MVRLNLQLFKGGVKSGSGSETVDQREAHFASENSRVEDMMQSRGFATVTMENGQILEHYTVDQLWDIFKESKSIGEIPQDDSWVLHYSDGHYETYHEGDGFGRGDALRRGLVGIGWNNASTLGIAGRGFQFVNYRERYGEKWSYGEDDWRIDESTDHPVYRQSDRP